MPRIQETIQRIRHIRGRLGRENPRPDVPDWNPLRAKCVRMSEITDTTHGAQRWFNPNMRYPPDMRHEGHAVGVVPTRGKAGVIFDMVNPTTVLGYVRDMSDYQAVAATLESVTGCSGWESGVDDTRNRMRELIDSMC